MPKRSDTFQAHFEGIKELLVAAGGLTAIPLIASLSSLEPPWPPAIGYVSAALVLVAAGVVWMFGKPAGARRRRTLAAVAVILTIAGLLAYLILYSMFVESIPGTDERIVRGYTCTAEAQLVYKQDCPDLPREALRDAEWDAITLWTRSSVTVARVSLTTAWLVFMAGLIAALSAIVAKPRD